MGKINTDPMKKYLAAIEAHKKGKDDQAAQLIAETVGLDKPTPIMKDSLKSLCNTEDPNIALVKLMMWEMDK